MTEVKSSKAKLQQLLETATAPFQFCFQRRDGTTAWAVADPATKTYRIQSEPEPGIRGEPVQA